MLCWLRTTLILAWLWLKSSVKLLAQRQCQEGMACPKSDMQSLHNMQHHSLDPYGGNEMVQQCFHWCDGCKQPWFWLGSVQILPNFCPATEPRRHGMSKIRHAEPSQHVNITHWTHMEGMKWSSSGFIGVLAANNLGFGLALAEICQTFGQRQCHDIGMACPKSATQGLHSMVTLLIGPIWRK